MRKIFFILVISAFSNCVAFSQSSQIKIANNSLGKLHMSIAEKADAKKRLTIVGEGIKAIEIAEKDKKTRRWPETWAIKAYLSSYVALIDPSSVNAVKYFKIAQEAYAQALKLDKFQTNGELISATQHNLHIKMQQDGTVAFERNDFVTAYELLKNVSDFMPGDTTLAINVGICAQNLQQHNDALAYFVRATGAGTKNPSVFQQISNLYSAKFETALAIKTLEDGLALNPSHPFLMSDYINILLDNEQFEKATKAVESLLLSEKRSKLLYFLHGYLQQNEQKNIETAEKSYDKALDLDANYFDALYQLAVVYLENANLALVKTDHQSYNAYINRAQYALLRAHDININDRNTVKLLIDIYTRKNRLDRVQALKQKLNEF